MTEFNTIPLQNSLVACPRCLTENDKSALVEQTRQQLRHSAKNVVIVARCVGCKLELPLRLTLPDGKVEAVDVNPYGDVVATTIAPEEIPFVGATRSEAEANDAYQNGVAAFEREDYLQAYASWRAAREWHAVRPDAWKVNAAILSNMGMALSRLRAPTMALQCFEEALHFIDSREDPDAYATVLNNVGFEYLHLGRMQEAEEYHRRAYELRRECGSDESLASGDRYNLAFTYAKMASRHAVSGEMDAAISRARQAVALYDGIKLVPEDCTFFVMLGNLLRWKGDAAIRANQPHEAVEVYSDAVVLQQQGGIDLEVLVADYDRLARLQRDLGLLNESLLTMQRLDELIEDIGRRRIPTPIVMLRKRNPIAALLGRIAAWLESILSRPKGPSDTEQ